ncbi:MAG: TRCF domain-containing protein, partial [Ilumatobacteraceae bacterium]
GAGNLLGEAQSGHIAAVGYDLYCLLVTEAVAEMKGETPPAESVEIRIDLPTDAHLPTDYVPTEDLRLEAYRRLAAATSSADVDDIETEWRDRYGPLPSPAENLVAVARLRATCTSLGIDDISALRGQVTVSPVRLAASQTLRLRRIAPRATWNESHQKLVFPLARGVDAVAAVTELLDELWLDD